MSKSQPSDNGAQSPDNPVANSSYCVDALRGLAFGNYSVWRGLTGTCTTADAITALGDSRGGDQFGNLGGSPTRYRVYEGTAASPHGVYIWDVEDKIVLVRIHDSIPARPVLDQLGEPEAQEMSHMPGFKTQWVYASRGLTLHIDDGSGAVAWIYAYQPMTVEKFRASWLSKVEIRRARVR